MVPVTETRRYSLMFADGTGSTVKSKNWFVYSLLSVA